MPLNNITKFCSAKSRRTGLPCRCPPVGTCKTCRSHGGWKKGSRKAPKGEAHWNFKDRNETKEARAERSATSAKLRYIRDIGDHIGMFTGTQTRGRKPTEYCKLDLNTHIGLNLALLKTSK